MCLFNNQGSNTVLYGLGFFKCVFEHVFLMFENCQKWFKNRHTTHLPRPFCLLGVYFPRIS